MTTTSNRGRQPTLTALERDLSFARAIKIRIDNIDDELADLVVERDTLYARADACLDEIDELATSRFQLVAALARVESRINAALWRAQNGGAQP